MLRVPQVEDCIRLDIDIPRLRLKRGDLGVVQSTWFSPATAYEVAFHPAGVSEETRVLVRAEQVHVEEGSPSM
ncbi:MAG: hypothetical protein ABSH20_12910 [Tepidisphaeraceae bacterium]|jgi:hypothetical protein